MLLGWEINLVVIWPFMETHYCHYYSHLNLKNATGRKKKEEWTRERDMSLVTSEWSADAMHSVAGKIVRRRGAGRDRHFLPEV